MTDRRRGKPRTPLAAGRAAKRPKPSLDLTALAGGGDDDHLASSGEEDYDTDESGRGRGAWGPPALDDEAAAAAEEPLEAKRVRLARAYLDRLKEESSASSSSSASEAENDDDDDGSEQDHIARKLQKSRQKEAGTYERAVVHRARRHVEAMKSSLGAPSAASARAWVDRGHVRLLRGHDLSPTCVALSQEHRVVSGSKDHSVMLWDVETQRRVAQICPHWRKAGSSSFSTGHKRVFRTAGQVLAVACSDDGRYAAVGRRDKTVQIYDIRVKANYNLAHTFDGHKGAVSCLAFRSGSHDLFSGSDDRCVRHYNLEEMMYLETLYGHQFGVTAIDCLAKERPISVGSDRTARAWKLAEDTHLIFRGGAKIQAAESISLIKNDWFLTGHQDGHLSLWFTEKKKAVVNLEQVHGSNADGVARPVVSVASLPFSDLAASGSCDGWLRFWNIQTGSRLQDRSMESAFDIPLDGYINAIAFGPKAKFCVAAVGQEHRLGRWERIATAKNRLAIISLRSADLGIDADDDDEKEEHSEHRSQSSHSSASSESSRDGPDSERDD